MIKFLSWRVNMSSIALPTWNSILLNSHVYLFSLLVYSHGPTSIETIQSCSSRTDFACKRNASKRYHYHYYSIDLPVKAFDRNDTYTDLPFNVLSKDLVADRYRLRKTGYRTCLYNELELPRFRKRIFMWIYMQCRVLPACCPKVRMTSVRNVFFSKNLSLALEFVIIVYKIVNIYSSNTCYNYCIIVFCCLYCNINKTLLSEYLFCKSSLKSSFFVTRENVEVGSK